MQGKQQKYVVGVAVGLEDRNAVVVVVDVKNCTWVVVLLQGEQLKSVVGGGAGENTTEIQW